MQYIFFLSMLVILLYIITKMTITELFMSCAHTPDEV